MNRELEELKGRITEAEMRFDKMRQLVDETGYDWDMIELKRMQRELDDLIKRYEDKVSKLTGRPYRYSSQDVVPQIGTHPFEHQTADGDHER
jgi:DNA polymerase I-like protein with 3'-5' exonuclease and polymerase domains